MSDTFCEDDWGFTRERWWRIKVFRAKVWHWRRNGHQWLGRKSNVR